jgi:hypothetical protein
MQFVTNGPDIPDSLLQAHEEGRVIFFCGAGISYPAGLPGFKKLVDDIYNIVCTTKKDIEERAYNNGQYDATLDLLERRLPGQRLSMRKALVRALKPKLRRKGAMETHEALLRLARNRDGVLRLVTTNFDRIFEVVAKRNKALINTYSAPMLPIPKNSRWDGLVYLHGLLPKNEDDSALHKLVLTSGDFGLAYLTERWAARFVSELFRNYIVCFVGYSINDPVLRYMMDALAADRMLGEDTPQAYALGDCEPGNESDKTIEWEAKGVRPILYEVPVGSHDHSTLHDTLKIWSETYRDGIFAKEAIVASYARIRPSASTRQDDFVGRMLWALSHDSGLPAKHFAEFNPAPSLEWLECFSHNWYQHSDLDRFGVPRHPKKDTELHFSLIQRPAPYKLAPWMSLVSHDHTNSRLDDVMYQLARWLVRHLNDPVLIIWLAENGAQLNKQLSMLIEHTLKNYLHMEQEGKVFELEEICKNSPNAIPEPFMRVLWYLLLSGRIKSHLRDWSLYQWIDRFKHNGLTTTLRLELRKLMKPLITLKKPFRWRDSEQDSGVSLGVEQRIDCELELASDNISYALRKLEIDVRWHSTLPKLFDDFQQLLCDALDLLRELGKANDYYDHSYLDLPSISKHWQNRGFRDWITLIELLRDSWIETHKKNQDRAIQIGRIWFTLPYPTFKRLALFAASQDNSIPSNVWVEWLTLDNSWWLWATQTQRETMRLIVLQGASLSSDDRKKLEDAILAGPPRKMFRDNIESDNSKFIVKHSVWLHLAKLQASGGDLGIAALQRYSELSTQNPEWKLKDNESDEFSHWMSGTGDPDYKESRTIIIAPRKRSELSQWLRQTPSAQFPFNEDTWQETCRARFFHSFFALCDLTQEGLWPIERWRDALQAWSEEYRITLSWHFVAPLIQAMPKETLQEIVHSFTWWLEAVSKSINRHEVIFLDLCRRILTLSFPDDKDNDRFVYMAINHPIGHVTQALLNLWFKRMPNDNDKLPVDIEPFFTQLCDIEKEQFRHGRVLLASQLIALFRVDRIWTEKMLLPLLDWSTNAIEAKAAWEGFLLSPRLYHPLLIAIKKNFFDTAHYYENLGESGQQFVSFMIYVALNTIDDYSQKDFIAAFAALPNKGLDEASIYLAQAIEGSGEQREEYWKNRILPFWQQIWPKSRELASNNIADSLARLCIATHNEFPVALAVVFDWLRPVEHPSYIIQLLHKSDLPTSFPDDSLRLLNAIIDDQSWAPTELGECLIDILKANPSFEEDSRYQRLMLYLRRRGIS